MEEKKLYEGQFLMFKIGDKMYYGTVGFDRLGSVEINDIKEIQPGDLVAKKMTKDTPMPEISFLTIDL